MPKNKCRFLLYSFTRNRQRAFCNHPVYKSNKRAHACVCARALKRKRRRRGTRSFGERYKCSDRNAAAAATASLTPAAHCRSLPPPSPRSFSLPRSSARRRNKRLARYPFRDSAGTRFSVHARCLVHWFVYRAHPLPWFLVSYRCGAGTATDAAATACVCVVAMSSDRVFERRTVSKRRTSANLEDVSDKQCPNGWAGVVAAAAATAAKASSRAKAAAAVKNQQRRTTFQPHPDASCDWFFKVSDSHLCHFL